MKVDPGSRRRYEISIRKSVQVHAEGFLDMNGDFWVAPASKFVNDKDLMPSFQKHFPGQHKFRQSLINQGYLVKQDEVLYATCLIKFLSASQAACIICGNSANWAKWLDSLGRKRCQELKGKAKK